MSTVSLDYLAQLEVEGRTDPDVIWGADQIAKIINRTERQTFGLLLSGHIKARKIGNRWVASRAELLATLRS